MSSELRAAYVLHAPDLARFVGRRVRDRHATPDVVHDVFLRVAEQPLAAVQDVRAYLRRVAHNLLADRRKQEARRRTLTVPHDAMTHIADDAPSPEDAANATLHLERLCRTLGGLPFKTRQIFVLTRIDGLSYPAAARRLGISLSTVEKHLAMAIRHVAAHAPSR